MFDRWRVLALLVIVALAGPATVSSADPGHGKAGGGAQVAERLFTLQPDPAGNPEGVAFDQQSKAFFVSSTADGAIYRGTLDSGTVSPFISGAAGKAAVGLKVQGGKLYVAGGPTGSITVYDLATRQVVAQFQTGTGGFLNDLVVTGRGDVFVTDSFRPVLWHVTAEQVSAGSGTPQALDVSAIPFEPNGQFNLNGIVSVFPFTAVIPRSSDDSTWLEIFLAALPQLQGQRPLPPMRAAGARTAYNSAIESLGINARFPAGAKDRQAGSWQSGPCGSQCA